MPSKSKSSNDELVKLMESINNKITILCTPEKVKSKLSELFSELREAKSEYDEKMDSLTTKISELLNDPSIWL